MSKLVTLFVSIHAHQFHQQPDLTRYTKRPKDAGWRQASSIFASKTLIFFFGIGATAAVQGKFGQAYWNQWDLLNAILDRFWGPAARAGCFFAAFGFTLSVVGVNIGCNSIPFGKYCSVSSLSTPRQQAKDVNRCGCYWTFPKSLQHHQRPTLLWHCVIGDRTMEAS